MDVLLHPTVLAIHSQAPFLGRGELGSSTIQQSDSFVGLQGLWSNTQTESNTITAK